MEFPQTLSYDGIAKREYTLKESNPEGYAFYQYDKAFGFKDGLEINKMAHNKRPDIPLIELKVLTGNSWGKGSWLICGTYYFRDLDEALRYIKGELVKPPKPKRKSIPQPEMSEDDLTEYLGLNKEELYSKGDN